MYILTPHLAAKLYPIALYTKYMFTDDVYMGVLVSQVKGTEVIVENMIGAHTEGQLSLWEPAFRLEGRMFYHVPNLTIYYKWYNLDNALVRYDPPPPPPATLRARHERGSGGIVLVLVILMIPLVVFAVIACMIWFENSPQSSTHRSW